MTLTEQDKTQHYTTSNGCTNDLSVCLSPCLHVSCLSAFKCICLFASLSICFYVSPYVHMANCQSVSESVNLWVSLSAGQPVSLSAGQSVSMSFCQSFSQSVCMAAWLSAHPSVCIYVGMSVKQSIHLVFTLSP
jgi:hypothetical protein